VPVFCVSFNVLPFVIALQSKQKGECMYNIHIYDNSILVLIDGQVLSIGRIRQSLVAEVGDVIADELLNLGVLSSDGVFVLINYRDHKGNLLTSLDPVECAITLSLQQQFEGM